MATIGVTELRSNLNDVLERVKRGDEIIITRNDEAVAALLHPSKLRSRVMTVNTKAADALLAELEQASRGDRDRGEGIGPERAEEMIAEIRAGRDAWI